MSPFFNDHTSYGAMIAFFIPLLVFLVFHFKQRKLIILGLMPIVLLFIIGLILSYTRAAWISLFLACFVVSILYFRINRTLIYSSILVAIIPLFIFQNTIFQYLEKNRQDSSKREYIKEKKYKNAISHSTNLHILIHEI